MKRIRNILLFLMIMAALFMAGDLLNLPLWPTDILSSSFPVEIRLELTGLTRESQEKILKSTHFRELILLDSNGGRIRQLHVDERGIARCVLQEGHYGFSASIPVIEAEKWYFFIYPGNMAAGDGIRKIDKGETLIRLALEKSHSMTGDALETILRSYLLDADVDSALVLASGISGERSDAIGALQQIEVQLAALPVDAYNSRLDLLNRGSEILTRSGIESGQQVLSIGGEIQFIESHRRAVMNARDNVIRSYIRIMQEFNVAGQLTNVLEEWNLMTGNPELYNPSFELPADIVSELQGIEEIVADIQDLIPGEIEANFQTAVEVYREGNLTDARDRFVRLASFIRNLNLGAEYETTESSILEYLEDIEIIAAANQAIRSDQLEKALDLYDMVAHPNAMVEERRLETIRFLQLRRREDLDS